MNRLVLLFLLFSPILASSLADWDRQISSYLEGRNNYVLFDISMEAFSLATPAIEWGWIYQNWRSDRLSKNYQIGTLGLLSTYTFVGITKYLIKRDRPKRRYKPRLWNTRLTPSFPSGHTASSAMWATILSRKNEGLLPWGYVALSAWSQVYVGNHYLSDVLSGAILGSTIGKIIETKHSHNVNRPLTSFSLQIRF